MKTETNMLFYLWMLALFGTWTLLGMPGLHGDNE